MGIYIKGTKMPTRCWDCPIRVDVDIDVGVAHGCGLLIEMIPNPTERLPDCPLVELPKHGRLIDADAQIERAKRLNLSTAGIIKTLLDTAPTIIKAEGDNE